MMRLESYSAGSTAGKSRRKAIAEGRHETLDGIHILSSLTPGARRALAAHCQWRQCGRRQQIVGHQDDSRTVYFLTAGKAHAAIFSENGKRVAFRDIAAGDIFGELSAIDGQPQAATVEAVTKCTVAAMSADAFWQLLCTEPAVMADLLKRVTSQARILSRKLFDLATLPVGRRIQAELLRLGESATTTVGKAVLYPAPSDADIAAQVGSTRETVNRELGEMIAAGVVERRGRTMIILDVEKVRGWSSSHPAARPRQNAKGKAAISLTGAALPPRISADFDHRRSRLQVLNPPPVEAVH
jgi:CRP/FNR family cyclic AMP-dependent transcriptional regulator